MYDFFLNTSVEFVLFFLDGPYHMVRWFEPINECVGFGTMYILKLIGLSHTQKFAQLLQSYTFRLRMILSVLRYLLEKKKKRMIFHLSH